MKKLIQIIILLVLSCCSPKNSLNLEAWNIDGLIASSPMYFKGHKVGTVSDISISPKNTIIVTVELTGELVKIPVDSKFELRNEGLFPNKSIEVVLGSSSELLTHSDTVKIDNLSTRVANSPNSIHNIIEDGISLLSNGDKLDSILVELRRLNKNFEGHIEEHHH